MGTGGSGVLTQRGLWKPVFLPVGGRDRPCVPSLLSPQGYSESPDLEFEYADTDKWAAELSGTDRPLCCLGCFYLIGL